MAKRHRDPAELAALIEQQVNRGLSLVEAFTQVTGKNAKTSRTLAIEHKRTVDDNRKALARYRRKVESAKTRMVGGGVVAGVTGAAGVVGLATGDPGVGGPLLLFTAAGVGLFVSLRARLRLKSMGPEPRFLEAVAPPPSLPSGRMGSAEIARFTSVRVQVLKMAPALDRLYPGSGDELRRADNEAAVPLTALAERLVILDQLQRDMPGTSAASTAASSSQVVRVRLADGCATYDELLAAAARLLAAPDATRSTQDVLGPAVNGMVAYAAGLHRLADL